MKNTKNLAWLDLETTGLDPAVDQILQDALFDIRQSIAELAHYRKTILQKP